MTWAAGQQLQRGQYIIREVIGMGRFGVTYRAETPDGESVVIKTPNDEARQHPDFEHLQQQFFKEAFKLARCKHPHIVRVKEPFQENNLWCIPMEYIAGVTLDKRDRRILPEDETLRYVQQIGEALVVVHQNQLLHRDVRPENIMLRIRNGQSEAVLIDFGLARDVDHQTTQTRTGAIAPGFAPLELYSSQAKRGAYTDIYSLGATLYTLLTGKIPPSADERRLSGTKLVLPDGISNATKQAIRWAMELEPKDRPQTMQDWLNALPQDGNSGNHLVKPPLSQPPRQKLETWQVIIAAIAALGALFGGLQGIAALMEAMKPNPSPSPTPTQTQTP
jgi:eukaryotic-like serine/threonine-protein kinase